MTYRASRLWPLLLLLPAAALLLWPDQNQRLFLFFHSAARLLPAAFWRLTSAFGDWRVVIALLLPLAWRQPQRLAALMLATLLAMLLVATLKAVFAVPRPPLVLPVGAVQLLDALPHNASFPSGHAMASALLATAWSADAKTGRWGVVLLAGAAGLVALSRLAIGVHWPLDVLVGALLGWGVMQGTLGYIRPTAWSTRGVERLLVMLSGLLLVLTVVTAAQDWPQHHEDYWLRVGAGTGIALLGFCRFRR